MYTPARPLTFFKRSFFALIASFVLTPPAPAAAPYVDPGNTEIGGFVGASYGIDDFRIMGGGNVCYALTRHIMPYAEFSYFPGIGRREDVTAPGASTARVSFSVPLADFHGGVHLRIIVKESPIVPYLVAGAGVVRFYGTRQRVSIPLQGLPPLNFDFEVQPRNDFAVNFGGGIRFYINERFGVRVEAKAYRPSTRISDVFGKVEGGFFFQLR